MKGRGCPGGFSPAAAIKYFKSLAPPSLHTPDDVCCLVDKSSASECVICSSFLRQPLELVCGVMVCCDCCCRWVEVSNTLACPCCYDHILDSETVKTPSAIVLELLSSTRLRCLRCNKEMSAAAMKTHVEHSCQYNPAIPSQFSASDILKRPLTATSYPFERQVMEHLVRRLLNQAPETGVVTVPTRGRVRK